MDYQLCNSAETNLAQCSGGLLCRVVSRHDDKRNDILSPEEERADGWQGGMLKRISPSVILYTVEIITDCSLSEVFEF